MTCRRKCRNRRRRDRQPERRKPSPARATSIVIAGFHKYQEILSGPPVTLVADLKESAAGRLEDIRNRIALTEEQLGRKTRRAAIGARRWSDNGWSPRRRVSSRSQTVADRPGAKTAPRLRRPGEGRPGGVPVVQVGRGVPCRVAALDLASADPDARSLFTSIAPKLEPPPGMALVPPGKYTVGGGPDNPRRTVELPFGVFIAVRRSPAPASPNTCALRGGRRRRAGREAG